MKTLVSKARVLLLAAMAMLLVACGQDDSQPAQGAREMPPVMTDVATISRQDITLDKTYSSLLRSDNEVTLVARVTGTLETRQFEQGDQVSKGQLLYTIEPEQYQAYVQEREADLQSARAELARAGRDAARYESLLKRNSVSRQQYDQALAEQQVARARVAQAEAALASARIDLDYTQVTAPVSGRVGLSQVNLGNLVNAGTELVTITPLDPLEVRFQVPLKDALELRNQLQLDDVNRIHASLALGESAGDSDTRLRGTLDFLDARVDARTSTVQASATFANPDAKILPGQFVRVSIEGLKRYNVIAVPEIAVTQGLMGPQVFVVDEDGKARARTVQLGEVAGELQIILDGLASGDTVVVGDPSGIKPGTPIKPRESKPAETEEGQA
ncbi:efflux RND transporter periplasmic adaptor subunit [Marinobacterium weihaiense]|uniref:Efflux RND transporter periplasmic adaptor subunit n=1 Tax=Marinobacterium weihaiense TaxID=2851016 RepID=A0ABS6M986_9GAMM|nr:efflux RND transporter periplasmic adaptor subunit [Marinobacterium weihaiense]MBV0932844.1 efflux RND transporter periplasmic adaptor subunit [Marinobacterium weihaiense]